MSGINAGHLLKHVVQPTLNYLTEFTGLAMNKRDAQIILIGIQAHESHGHQWLSQYPSGPGRGGYQQEIATHDWIRDDYLKRRKTIGDAVRCMVPEGGCTADRMTYDLAYATAMARIYLWTIPEPLPSADDMLGMARYYKKYWNTKDGAATEEKFIHDFRLYAGSVL